MDPGIAAIIAGAVSGTTVGGLGAMFVRKRTKAETSNVLANAANILAQGAGDLVTSNADRIKDLERRLTNAEEAAVLAHKAALQARESEGRCLHRLEELQAQITELRALVQHPPITTTVTTAVTTQEAPTP